MQLSRLALCAVFAATACERERVTHTHDEHHDHHGPTQPTAPPGRVQTYYIAADEVTWDYAPAGRDLITGKPFDAKAKMWVTPGKHRIGSRYQKAVYREYTDATFSKLKPRDPRWVHLGIMGPLLRASVGDTFEVHFRNNTRRPASIHPHGVFYTKANEGSPYADGTSGANKADDAVAPGATYIYRWSVPESAGPTAHDGTSVMWMYHSHVDEVRDVNAGLLGPMIVTARGKARPDGSPTDVDREFITTFQIFDENQSPYTKPRPNDAEYVESNMKHGINGYLFGNLPGLDMKRGERVRWYLMAMGSEVDIHTPHWHANTVVIMHMRTDVGWLLPGTMQTADMKPMATGTWLFHCHVHDHIDAGMLALYRVSD